jgi:outer membrane lipoprotein carrier protein
MMRRRSALPAMALLMFASGVARANGLALLEQFVRQVSTARSEFTQVVTAPAREGEAARTRTSSGTFELSRPNRFRFNYRKPFEQTIVADGQTLWLHDVDLNQVTARNQAQVLGSTPAALIAAASDLRAVQAQFALQDGGEQDGLQWVLATPRVRDGQLQSVRVGLRPGGPVPSLAVLEIVDSFGQRSVLRFTAFEINPALLPATFVFKPPAGADVVRP